MALVTSAMPDNDTVFVDEDLYGVQGSTEYYGILIVAAVFFAIFALASSVYLRQRRLRLEHYPSLDERPWTSSVSASSTNYTRARRSSGHRPRDLGRLQPLDVSDLAPPAYEDLPPSYEDSIKQRGVINLGFTVDSAVQGPPPTYLYAMTEGANQPSTSRPSRVETSVQTELGRAYCPQPTGASISVITPSVASAAGASNLDTLETSPNADSDSSSDDDVTYRTCPSDSPAHDPGSDYSAS